MGVLEVAEAGEHAVSCSPDAAPIVASAMGLLAAQGVGDGVLEPLSVEAPATPRRWSPTSRRRRGDCSSTID